MQRLILLIIFVISWQLQFSQILVVKDITCNGYSDAKLLALPDFGAGPYSFQWNTGATTQFIENVGAGNYQVTVTDQSVFITAVYSIVLTDPPPVNISYNVQNVSCNGYSDGMILASATGFGALSYQWSNGATSPTIDGLSAGTYTLTVTDSKGCTAVENITVFQPNQISIVSNITPSYCDGHNTGQVILTVNGGVPSYSFYWREIHYDSIYTTQNLTNIRGGEYELTITDMNNCTYVDIIVVPTIYEVPVVITPTSYVCNGLWGAVTILAPLADTGVYYHYAWSSQYNSGSFTTNDTVYAISQSFPAGIYSITVTDPDGCQHYYNGIIVESDAPLAVQSYVIHNRCYGDAEGQISIFVTGGDPRPSYSITWTGPNGYTSNGFTIASLISGDYRFFITDNVVCSYWGTIRIEPSSPLQGYIIPKNVECVGDTNGLAHAFYQGGTGYLTYFWSTGEVTSSVYSLPMGTYTLTVTDQAGCEVIDTLRIDTENYFCYKIPNLVTMNNDGFNDVFRVEGMCNFENFLVRIYTDWGKLVFESTNCNFIWDPADDNAQANQVYYCYVSFAWAGQIYEFKTSITILN